MTTVMAYFLEVLRLPYFPDHKLHQDFRRQIYGKNFDALSDHKTQGNFVQYFPGKKCSLWFGKYDNFF
jgi:hypothetical protein